MVNFRLVATFVTTTLVFLLGIFFGQYISYYNLSEFKKIQDSIISEVMGYELTFSILSEQDICNMSFEKFIKERIDLGQRLAGLEEKFGPNNEHVLALKERYHLYQIREYLFFRNLRNKCNFSEPLILYFYSHDCDECIAQGKILDAISGKYKIITIYAISYEIDNPAIRALKNVYNITSTPSLVINEVTYNKLLRLDEIEKIIYG
jgi:thiol-disulfide isomerase/thioredoxin